MRTLNEYVLVRPKGQSNEKTTGSGIILIEKTVKNMPHTGVAEIVCEGSHLKVGEEVMYRAGRFTPVTQNGTEYHLVHEDDVMLVL